MYLCNQVKFKVTCYETLEIISNVTSIFKEKKQFIFQEEINNNCVIFQIVWDGHFAHIHTFGTLIGLALWKHPFESRNQHKPIRKASCFALGFIGINYKYNPNCPLRVGLYLVHVIKFVFSDRKKNSKLMCFQVLICLISIISKLKKKTPFIIF